MKKWSAEQIQKHVAAAKKLEKIMQTAFDYIAANKSKVNERQVQEFILGEFKKNKLKMDNLRPIVAFGKTRPMFIISRKRIWLN